MPNIHPFQGWRYNPEVVEDAGTVIAPPYDVISPREQDTLYQSSPYNFVRLILNSAPGESRYSESARVLREWIKQRVVIQDQPEALYLLDQTFLLNGEQVTRTGIIAALELEEMGKNILPHEQTIAKHIEDRYRLMESTKTNLGQIFMSYRDRTMTVESMADTVREEQPVLDIRVPEHGRYALWRMTNPEVIRSIRKVLANTSAIIADGHHRYKTALRYVREHPAVPGGDRVMVTLVNAFNPGMQVLPTHRLVRGVRVPLADIRKSLERFFTIAELASPEELMRELGTDREKDIVRLGLYHRASSTALLLMLRNEEQINGALKQGPRAYQLLDVNILHQFVLKEIFHLDTENQADLERLHYLRGNTPAPEQLREARDYDVACFVKPPDLETLFTVAEAGLTLPQKTTYFYPKVYSGLVFRFFG